MSDLHELTALETAEAVRRGDTSVLDVVDHALARAETLGARLGAFALLTPERAREAAREPAVADGARSGSLWGVPTAVKDLTATAGVRTGRGSVIYRDWVPETDDDLVGLLRAAGTVSLGKTAVPEFGLPCYTEPAGAAPAVTPWDVTRSAGGSSGGAAAAVAAGVVPVAQGSDGGGSIRIPASVCGLVGLKTTRGRVPAGPAAGDPAGLSVAGPLARTVADAAALLDVLCGDRSWPGEPLVPRCPPEDGYLGVVRRGDGPRRRIGLCTTVPYGDLAGLLGPVWTGAPVDPVCVAAAEDTARVLESLGHVVEPVDVRLPDEVVAAFLTLWATLALADPVDPADEDRLQPLTRLLRARGREVSGIAALGALQTVQVATRRIVTDRAGLDAVLTPSVALPPRPVGWFSADGPETDFARQVAFTPWTAIANMTGEPALGLPTGWPRVDGVTLPVGVTLRGRRGEEDVLLALGAELEAATPWAHRRPPVW
ncbi:amidase [Actinomycetospora sp. NBRC 106378]|uniref:amidase n=1 Tax=Actinomycetospora sp. NBRC 106378 TaxID=3032208 RepID=UPI0024A5F1C0|nr:amidase [Actinomycetospora sp. NBRC 106378]GLZ55215.1 amidase [Actinomycetospora sp. NBRC 106378]